MKAELTAEKQANECVLFAESWLCSKLNVEVQFKFYCHELDVGRFLSRGTKANWMQVQLISTDGGCIAIRRQAARKTSHLIDTDIHTRRPSVFASQDLLWELFSILIVHYDRFSRSPIDE